MRIKNAIRDSISIKEAIYNDESLQERVAEVIKISISCFNNGGRVLFCGNGGSASDAQHLAAEFSGRFYFDREPLDSEALHVNTSFLTAVANDYSYDEIFSRLVRAKGRKGDVLIGLSTSGNSENIIRAFDSAKLIGMKCVAFTGETGGKMKNKADILINVPSMDTPRIQESHILLGHIVCEEVEKAIFKK